MSKNRFRATKPNDIPIEHVVEEPKMFGVVSDCNRLNIRMAPFIEAEVMCIVDEGTELMLDMACSTEEWYKVYHASGNEGYCMKKFIALKQ